MSYLDPQTYNKDAAKINDVNNANNANNIDNTHNIRNTDNTRNANNINNVDNIYNIRNTDNTHNINDISTDYIKDILQRKEFYNLYKEVNYNLKPAIFDMTGKFFQPMSYQLFIRNIMNPNTPNKRMMIKYDPGTGKTITAIMSALKFIAMYKLQYKSLLSKMPPGKKSYVELDRITPSVYVLGFGGTVNAFINDMLKNPELGFISHDELAYWNSLKTLAQSGLPEDIRKLREITTKLRKRITSKKQGGFFKFYGYQEFTNKLFSSETIDLTDIESLVKLAVSEIKMTAKANGANKNEINKRLGEITLQSVINRYIENGTIVVNKKLLKSFENSVLICDEFHNLYNSIMKNNYGVAVQYVLDANPNTRALFISATPINNSPREIVDIITLLCAPGEYTPVVKDLFSGKKLLPGALEKIERAMMGKVSFLQDNDLESYPRRIIMGESIFMYDMQFNTHGNVARDSTNNTDRTWNAKEIYSEMPYLKFIRLPMSPLHRNTYDKMIKDYSNSKLNVIKEYFSSLSARTDNADSANNADNVNNADTANDDLDTVENIENKVDEAIGEFAAENESKGKKSSPELQYDKLTTLPVSNINIPMDGYAIYDMVYPNPNDKNIGLYRTSEIKSTLLAATDEWKTKNKCKLVNTRNSITITGEFLQADNLAAYSIKYHWLITKVIKSAKKQIKMMIFHDKVNATGVIMIGEIFKMNGFLDEFSDPIDSTLCCYCARPMSDKIHDNIEVKSKSNAVSNKNATSNKSAKNNSKYGEKYNTKHDFHPARFIIAHSEIDKTTMDRSIQKFNMPDNARGVNYKIIIGSKVIKESYEINCVRKLFLVSLPVNVPTMKQVFGRTIRKNSHGYLPYEEREVKIYIIVYDMEILTDVKKFAKGDVTSTDAKNDAKNAYTSRTDTSRTDTMRTDKTFDIKKNSLEEYRYADKISDYLIIQDIERAINKIAVDGNIHRNIIMKPMNLLEYFPGADVSKGDQFVPKDEPLPILGNLYFEPIVKFPNYTIDDLNLTTFNAYNYGAEEVNTIFYIIKLLFMREPIYTYESLWAMVKSPPWRMEVNTSLFLEGNFVIALNNICYDDSNVHIVANDVLYDVSNVNKMSSYSNHTSDHVADHTSDHVADHTSDHVADHTSDHVADNIADAIENNEADNTADIANTTNNTIDTTDTADTTENVIAPRKNANYSRSAANVKMGSNSNFISSLFDYSDRYIRFNGTKYKIEIVDEYFIRFPVINNVVIRDIESFDRGISLEREFILSFDSYIRDYHEDVKYKIQRDEYIYKVSNYYNSEKSTKNVEELTDIITSLVLTKTSNFYLHLLEEIIEQYINLEINKKGSLSPKTVFAYERILDLFYSFGMLVTLREVVRYKEVGRKISNAKIVKIVDNKPAAQISPSAIIGYIGRSSVYIFNSPGWIEVNKNSMNISTVYNENNSMVGYLEISSKNEIKFKIRTSINIIKKNTSDETTDYRLLERGAACETKSKQELRKILNTLNIKNVSISDAAEAKKVKNICTVIRDRLIELEQRERKNGSNVKYFYLLHEERPKVGLN